MTDWQQAKAWLRAALKSQLERMYSKHVEAS
jgi:hypothetical protein